MGKAIKQLTILPLLTGLLLATAPGQPAQTPADARLAEQAKPALSSPAAETPSLPATADLVRQNTLPPKDDKLGAKPPKEDPLRLGTEVINLAVTVTDPYGRFVTGLDQSHFEIFEDKVKQRIEFFNDNDAPVSLGIIFDVSGSMKSRVSWAQQSLRRFIDASHTEDDFFLVGFNSTAQLLRDFTTDGRAIANSLMLVSPKGNTALYDAVYLGVEKVRQGRHKRRAVIIISDGQDNDSRYTFREVRKIIKEADVQIYALGIVDLHGNNIDMQGQSILEEIARTTGGRAFFPTSELELEDMITRIALELRHQYTMAYVSQDGAADGRWRKLRVVVNPPKGLPRLTVRAREGYFAQKPIEPTAKQ